MASYQEASRVPVDPQIDTFRGISPKRRSRRTIAIAAVVIVIAAGVLGLLGTALWETTQAAPGLYCGNTRACPLQSYLTLNASRDTSGDDTDLPECATTACNFYTFTVAVNTTYLFLGDLDFLLKEPGGDIATISGGLVVVGSSGTVLGTYNLHYSPDVSPWTPVSSANTSLRNGDAVLVFTTGPSAESLEGFELVAFGMNEFSGAISSPFI